MCGCIHALAVPFIHALAVPLKDTTINYSAALVLFPITQLEEILLY